MNIQAMKDINPCNIDRNQLVERSCVKINPNATREERLQNFIRQIKNPYCYLDGKTVVKISFSNTDTTMEDCVAHYLRGL